MYFKTVWGFSGTDEQKELQKKQLRDVLTRLGADIAMDEEEFDDVVKLFKKLWKKYGADESGLCIGTMTY